MTHRPLAAISLGILGTLGSLLLATALSARTDPDPPTPPSFSETAEVLSVEVPVTVTVGETPVRGLTLQNFEVWSGKQRQPVVDFEVVDLAAAAVAPAAAAATPGAQLSTIAAGRRHLLFLFDLGFSQPSALERARAAARGVLASALHESDMVAVAAYSPTDGARLLLGFTADHEEAKKALDLLGHTQLVERNADPLRLTLAMADQEMIAQAVTQTAAPGAKADITAERKQGVKEEMYDRTQQASLAADRSQRDAARDRVEAMARSFGDLAHLLGTVPGRKTVLLLSEGFDSSLLLGKEQSRADRATLESGELWKVDTDKAYGSGTMQANLGRMLEEFRRAGCVIEAVDVGGLRGVGDVMVDAVGSQQVGGDPGQSTAGQDGLFVMAHETGGDLFRNTNDIATAMQTALAKSNVTYVLTLAPPDVVRDGRYYPLVVKLKNGPKGAHVAARSGFYSPKPYAERSAAERGMESAGLIMAGQEGGALSAALLAVPLAAPPGQTARVAVWLEVDGETLMRDHKGDTLAMEIFLYALDSHARVRDRLTQTLKIDTVRVGPTLWERGVKIYGELALPAGSYSLRALIRNAATGASALRMATLEVRETAGGPQLLAPLVPEPANKWLTVPANRAGEAPVVYPFVVGTRPVMPAAQPVLLTGVDIPLCVFAYGLSGGDGGEVRVRLRDQAGAEHEVSAQLMDRAAAGAGLERLLLKLRATDVANGDYTLRVALLSGGATVESAATAVAVVRREGPAGAP